MLRHLYSILERLENSGAFNIFTGIEGSIDIGQFLHTPKGDFFLLPAARNKSDRDVGRTNARRLWDKARRFVGDIGRCTGKLGKGRNMREHEKP
jgi:hypothetical protein